MVVQGHCSLRSLLNICSLAAASFLLFAYVFVRRNWHTVNAHCIDERIIISNGLSMSHINRIAKPQRLRQY